MHQPIKLVTRMINLAILSALVIGCNDRVADIAREAADRQADQNRQMANLQEQVASGSHELVAADARAREEIIKANRDLAGERSNLHADWEKFDADRRQFANERRVESLLVPVLHAAGMVAVVVVVIGFSWHALVRSLAHEPTDGELNDLLIEELAAMNPGNETASSARLLHKQELLPGQKRPT